MTAQPLPASTQEPRRIARLRAKVEAALPGIRVNQVLLAQRSVSQAWLLLSYWIVILQPWRVLLVTDAGIHVYTTSRTTTGRPGSLLGTLPPDFVFGEPKGMFRTVREIGPERLSIHRAYWPQLRAADADQPRRAWAASQGVTSSTLAPGAAIGAAIPIGIAPAPPAAAPASPLPGPFHPLGGAPPGAALSPDGRWWWDGRAWQPVGPPAP